MTYFQVFYRMAAAVFIEPKFVHLPLQNLVIKIHVFVLFNKGCFCVIFVQVFSELYSGYPFFLLLWCVGVFLVLRPWISWNCKVEFLF